MGQKVRLDYEVFPCLTFQRYTFYHYTDEKGAKVIEESKTIKASTNTATDAAFGKGNF